jgi:hypothetical protein
MTLGRPTINLKSSRVPLPAAIDDENLHSDVPDCHQTDCLFSRIQFYLENVKLGGILGDILADTSLGLNLEENQLCTRRKQQLSIVLSPWTPPWTTLKGFVPGPLNWANEKDISGDLSAVFSRQGNVLHAR